MTHTNPSTIAQSVTWYEPPLLGPLDSKVVFGDYTFYAGGLVELGARCFAADDEIVNHVFNGHRANRPSNGVLTIIAPSGETYHFVYKAVWIPFLGNCSNWYQSIPRYGPIERPRNGRLDLPFWQELRDGLNDVVEYGTAIVRYLWCKVIRFRR
jgi:hypothetical protein